MAMTCFMTLIQLCMSYCTAIGVCGYYYHKGPCGHPEYGSVPVTKLMCKRRKLTGTMVQDSYTNTKDYGDIWPRLLSGAIF